MHQLKANDFQNCGFTLDKTQEVSKITKYLLHVVFLFLLGSYKMKQMSARQLAFKYSQTVKSVTEVYMIQISLEGFTHYYQT